jgi:UDP-MurNAc hydroxylase
MKLTYIYNACVLIEHQGKKVLCDPWLSDAIYYGSWFKYPPINASAKDFFDIDYLYISHIHPDHLDVKTLKEFPREIPVLICSYAHKFLLKILKRLGFKKIIELSQKDFFELGPDFKIEIIAADFCNPKLCDKHFACAPQAQKIGKSEQIDSMAIFSTPTETLLNLNDVPYGIAYKSLEYIKKTYPQINCLLVGYSGAGPYPQCFDNLDPTEKSLKASLKKKQFLNQAIAFIKTLNPEIFMPFAGQYVLGGSLHTLNKDRGVPEVEELRNLFDFYLKEHDLTAKMLQLNSMEHFDLDKKKCSKPFTPPNPVLRKKYIEEKLTGKKLDYEEDLYDVNELKKCIYNAYDHLIEYQKKWNYTPKQNLYIDFGEKDFFHLPIDGKALRETSELVEPYVKIKLNPRLLSRILQKKAHWNNAEIGSHLSFDRRPDFYDRGLYFTLSFFHC